MNIRHVTLFLLGLIFLSSISLAQTTLLPVAAAAPGPLPKPGPLKIVRIMDHQGTLSYEVLDDEIIRLMKKDLGERYKNAKKEWSGERDAWKEKYKGVTFALPKPLSPKVTIVAKGFNSRSEAEAELAMIQSSGPFCIYQVTNGKKKSVDIIPCTELDGVKYSLQMEYHEALADWAAARAAFEEENPEGKFDQAMPSPNKVRVLKNKIKTMEKASSQMSKYED